MTIFLQSREKWLHFRSPHKDQTRFELAGVCTVRLILFVIDEARECLFCECLLCPECKQTQLGREYMGTLSMTVSGKTCQAWASNTPHEPNPAAQNDANFPDGSRAAARNYCRNPDSEAGPWCYTTDPDVRWEMCTVPYCATSNGYFTPIILSNVV